MASHRLALAQRPNTLFNLARPDGTLLAFQPYGREGLLVADLDLDAATGLLAKRYRDVPPW